MTNEQNPREFWIEQFNGRVPPSFYAFKDKPNFCKLKLKIGLDSEEINASEYFHVIEYSAYEKLQKEIEELKVKLQMATATIGSCKAAMSYAFEDRNDFYYANVKTLITNTLEYMENNK